MQTFVLESSDRQELGEAAQRLWDDLNITGEMGLKQTDGGRWRLEIWSEREVDESELERFNGLRTSS